MAGKVMRATIVGAASSLGKELAELLNDSTAASWDVSLVDPSEAGQVTAAGDEALVIAPLEGATFTGMDIVFFAGDPASTRAGWKQALAAKAMLVDLTGVLESEAGAILYAPGSALGRPDLTTAVVSLVHPAAWVLARAAARTGARRVLATVLGPASQLGDAAMDELHQQTVALLSFQNQPREIYDAQAAFALRDEFGPASKLRVRAERERMMQHFRAMLGNVASISLEVIQAPVFHGTTASVWLEFPTAVSQEDVSKKLDGGDFLVVAESADADVSNQAATGQNEVLTRVRSAGDDSVWLWLAMDNIRWMARTAETCALEMLTLRPSPTVQ